ncbi:Ubiquitin-conjugating enzyme E1 [Spironucleus salmonicida]|uniref:Ubiquitin-like 1-activating enzyme E1A n=1 Tax=Spironucleus salmonicida TaxID=348837 RepID=V6LGR4_9EUKA|nr:Ubiquitin-conjugating enzyme E1 [Spironucleus salmonicida]|eukprot:EST43697.1 Ubiquitin-conjugating enzyme E1 [Spironucleus salmonicida]
MSEVSRDYSRTEYVFGKEALTRMQNATFLILGCSGTGAEVGKNILLTGCSVALYDPSLITSLDLASHPFLTTQSIGQRKDEFTANALSPLNTQKQSFSIDLVDLKQLLQYSAIIYTESINFTVAEVSTFCHDNQIPFIISQTKGLCGRVFCDFGEKFTILDTDGELVQDLTVSSVMVDKVLDDIIISFEMAEVPPYVDDILILVKDVHFSLIQDEKVNEQLSLDLMQMFNNQQYKIKILGPKAFKLQVPNDNNLMIFLSKLLDDNFQINYVRGGYTLLIKEPKVISFKPYQQCKVEPVYCDEMIDFAKFDHRAILHQLFIFIDENEQLLPTDPWNTKQVCNFVQKLNQICVETEQSRRLCHIFAGQNMAQIASVSSIIAAWGAQEALKAVSGKFTPLQQFFYFDAFELIKEFPEDAQLRNNRYDGQIAAFGIKKQQMIQNQSVFLVGAGALGCELIKLFALSGACTEENTMLTITDLDSIENSNLSRQFLFREKDSGKMKSSVAAEKAQEMNPGINIEALTARVGSSNPLSSDFWNSQTIICNALDNTETRRFVDGKCVEYNKPLLESGTLGQKSNTQIVVPRLTQIYSATVDQQTSEAPACTIHNFPNNITHCIVYVMSEFNGLFMKAQEDLQLLFNSKNSDQMTEFAENIFKEQSSMKKRIQQILTFTQLEMNSQDKCIKFAFSLFRKYFFEGPETLLQQFPIDSKNKDGSAFWLAEKRPPKCINFDIKNKFHIQFIQGLLLILSQIYKFQIDQTMLIQQIELYFKQINSNIANADQFATQSSQIDDLKSIADLQVFLQNQIKHRPKNLQIPVTYEKDDPSNGHVEFVSGFANLRAESYSIPTVSNHEIRRVSGNIIPAMITSTAAICGHIGIEYFKLCFKFDKLEDYKQIFMNFALPLLQIAENECCTKMDIGNGKFLTVWDQMIMEGDPTIQQVLDFVQNKHQVKIDSITVGPRALFMGFMDKPEKKLMKIREVIRAGNKEGNIIDANVEIILEVMPEDDEIVLPNLKLQALAL